ncbi:hypothetical protein ACQJBY_042433 [Aegilops geniculata]
MAGCGEKSDAGVGLNGTRTSAAAAAPAARRPPRSGSRRSRQHTLVSSSSSGRLFNSNVELLTVEFLSDPNKRILYDVGAYDSDGDDEGAGEILGDILEAMNHTPPHEDGESESLEDLHKQFEELFLKPDAYAYARSSKSSSSSSKISAGKK